jgi:hypothetical protein
MDLRKVDLEMKNETKYHPCPVMQNLMSQEFAWQLKEGNDTFSGISQIEDHMNEGIGKNPVFKNVTYKAGCAPQEHHYGLKYDTLEVVNFNNTELQTYIRPSNGFKNRNDGTSILGDIGWHMDKSEKVAD